MKGDMRVMEAEIRLISNGGEMKPNFNQNYKGIRCRVCLIREASTDEVISINNQSDVYELVKDELVNSDREILLSVMITIRNALIGVETISIGSITASTTTPRDVFKSVILANAVAIILCHNHPSGDLTPSGADIHITRQLIAAGDLLGIKVLDHLIVSNSGYKSLLEIHEFKN
jgi:DNA repair protein RadC